MSWMEQYTALQQWKTGLSIRTAFDPLHFVDEPFNWSSPNLEGRRREIWETTQEEGCMGNSQPTYPILPGMPDRVLITSSGWSDL